MKNIEKYKGIVLKNLNYCKMETDLRKIGAKAAIDCAHTSCEECKEKYFKWLLEEYKDSILTDKEREYLSTVIKPFREKIKAIEKYPFCGLSCKKEEYIIVRFHDGGWSFPRFTANTMYKGMEVYKSYTLKELGL